METKNNIFYALVVIFFFSLFVFYYIIDVKNDEIERLNSEIKYYKDHRKIYQGMTTLYNGKALNYNVMSFDCGINWYLIDIDSLSNHDAIKIIGNVETIYPGLMNSIAYTDSLIAREAKKLRVLN